ncbi:putative VIER F-box protein 1, partial [Dinochytrium kinnereticum]
MSALRTPPAFKPSPGAATLTTIPPETFALIVPYLSNDPSTLLACSLASKNLTLGCLQELYRRPATFRSLTSFESFIKTLQRDRRYAPMVKRLHLSSLGSELTDSHLSMLASTDLRLEKLGIASCRGVEGPGFAKLLRRVGGSLRCLDAGLTNAMTGEVARAVADARGLKTLVVAESNVDDEGLSLISEGCRRLKRVDVSGCGNVTERGVMALVERCLDVTDLNISMVPRLPLEALMLLMGAVNSHFREARSRVLRDLKASQVSWVSLPNTSSALHTYPFLSSPAAAAADALRTLDLSSSSSNLSTPLIIDLLRGARRLRGLNLSRCAQVNDAVCHAIASVGSGMEQLNLGYCSGVTDEGVARVAKGCRRLRGLDVSGLAITDKGLHAITSFCSHLRRLSLTKCRLLTDTSFLTLSTLSTTLERLHLSYNPNLSLHIFRVLISRCWYLRHITLSNCPGVLNHSHVKQWSLPAPLEYTEDQKAGFCVLDGKSLGEARTVMGIPWLVEEPGIGALDLAIAMRSGGYVPSVCGVVDDGDGHEK